MSPEMPSRVIPASPPIDVNWLMPSVVELGSGSGEWAAAALMILQQFISCESRCDRAAKFSNELLMM